MNIIASIFISISITLLTLVIFVLILWMWRGGGIFFPGFGLLVSTPAFVTLLLVLSIVLVILAAFIKPKPQSFKVSTPEFEYPNDIFSGCGNGTLTLSLAKDPNNYNENTDRGLRVCINDEDLAAIQDAVVIGRIDYRSLQDNEDYQKADERNREVFQQFASLYPMLGKFNDMYQDYVFTPEEVKRLQEECLKLQSAKPNSSADLAVRKFIYACDETLKDDFHLMFSGD